MTEVLFTSPKQLKLDRYVIMERVLQNMRVETRITCQLLPIFSLQNIRN